MKTTIPADLESQISQETKDALVLLSTINPLSHYWLKKQYIEALYSYVHNKGEDMLQALAGFYLWAAENLPIEKRHVIESTFAHDLGQQRDEWMLPRSSSYLKFWQNRKEVAGA